jgi:flagellar motor protein MotB
MPRRSSFLLLALSLVLLLASCMSARKTAKYKERLTVLDSQLVVHRQQLKQLDEKRQAKERQNQIDDTANTRISQFIDRTRKDIDTLIQENTVLINGNVVSRDDWNELKQGFSATLRAEKIINRKKLLLEDLVNRNMVIKLDQDVLFAPGSYTVAPELVNDISKLFVPAAEEIEKFSKKYPDFTLSLVITAKGYADATSIAEGSTLYKNLKERLRLSLANPDNRELNKELSRARAEAVKKLFEAYANSRADNGIYRKNVLYLYEGKGEEFPDPKISNYSVNDPRRRIVLLFWSIFPD